MSMNEIVQVCIDGCGRRRIFNYPDGFSPIPDFDHVARDAEIAQSVGAAKVDESAAFDAKVRAVVTDELAKRAL